MYNKSGYKCKTDVRHKYELKYKARELDTTLRSYMAWLPVTLSALDMLLYNLQLDDVTGADFENSLYAFG